MHSYSLLFGIVSMCLLVTTQSGKVAVQNSVTPDPIYDPVVHIRDFLSSFNIQNYKVSDNGSIQLSNLDSNSLKNPKYRGRLVVNQVSGKLIITTGHCNDPQFSAHFNVVSTNPIEGNPMKNLDLKLCKNAKTGEQIRDELSQTPDLANLRALKDSCNGSSSCTLKLNIYDQAVKDIVLTGGENDTSSASGVIIPMYLLLVVTFGATFMF